MSDTDDPLAAQDLPPGLRFLKWLVTALAVTMILGLITIVALLVIRLPGVRAPSPTLPAELRLPEGVTAGAVTFGRGWYAVVSEAGDEILIFDAASGDLRQRVTVGE